MGRADPAAAGHRTLLVMPAVIGTYYTYYPICHIQVYTYCVCQAALTFSGEEEKTYPEGSRGQVNAFQQPFGIFCFSCTVLLKEFMKMNAIISVVWGYAWCIPLLFSIPTFSVAHL